MSRIQQVSFWWCLPLDGIEVRYPGIAAIAGSSINLGRSTIPFSRSIFELWGRQRPTGRVRDMLLICAHGVMVGVGRRTPLPSESERRMGLRLSAIGTNRHKQIRRRAGKRQSPGPRRWMCKRNTGSMYFLWLFLTHHTR